MEDLFNEDGHLTEYAIKCNIEGSLDELQRLEISEHLSFCDKCLEAYLESLTEDKIIEPFESCVQDVDRKVRNKRDYSIFRRYLTASIAACFAMTLWVSGVFSINYIDEIDQFHVSMLSENNIGITEITKTFTENISDGINNAFKNIKLKGVFK